MLGIFDLGNWNDRFIIFVESNDKSLRIGMYWDFLCAGKAKTFFVSVFASC